jgi:hypothetical protein
MSKSNDRNLANGDEPKSEPTGDSEVEESETPPDRADDITFTQAIEQQENPALDHLE